ncbi:MAG: hypothetical protein PHW07_06520 [Sulfurospirillaceae bacterium]|nr:hypothetical protein [Sulfurospirillaceae bacterium]
MDTQKMNYFDKALEKWNWAEAGREMKDSNWYVQVGNRSKRNFDLMVRGEI